MGGVAVDIRSRMESGKRGESARQPFSNLASGGLSQDSGGKGHGHGGGNGHGHGGGTVLLDNLKSDEAGGKEDGDPRVLKDPGKGQSFLGKWSLEGQRVGRWSSLFGVKPSSKSSFPAIKVISGQQSSSIAILVPDEMVDHNVAAIASTLVGKFMGTRLNIDMVRIFTKKKWPLKGQVLVTTMAKGFMAFEFSCQEDLAFALCGGPWNISRSILVLQKWTSRLDLNDSFFIQASVWVRLLEFPLEYWNEELFVGLASSFGVLLSIDPVTASRKRFTYARICIGVKVGVDMPESVSLHSKLGVHVQKLIYESIPFSFFLCKKGGHSAKKCPSVQEAKNRARWNRKPGEDERQEQHKERMEEQKDQKVELEVQKEGVDNLANPLVIPDSSCDQEGAKSNCSGSPNTMEDDRMEEQKEAEPREAKKTQEERKLRKAPLSTQNDSVGKELKEDLKKYSFPQEGQSMEEMLSQSIASLEFVSEVQETQYSNESLISPYHEGQQKTPRWEASLAGQALLETTSLQQEANLENMVDDSNASRSQNKKKKNGRDPYLVSPIETRSKIKADVRSKGKTPRRPSSSQTRQEEARRNIANGTQRTILQACSIKKP